MKEKRHFCFNCGADLGVYKRYPGDPPECCSERECQRALRETQRNSHYSERDEVDDYYRNRGGYY